MDKKIKKEWVKALESGDYSQTRSQLKLANSYCCLGVLCDILPAPNKKKKWTDNMYTGVSNDVEINDGGGTEIGI